MNSHPLVSIITPSFNQAAFLERTILSVLNQEYPNLEYWIIDGGSTDGSVDIIKKYENVITGWISEKDRGQADAINKGFSRANGEIIAWMNSDDVYRPGAINAAVQALQENPDCGLVFSDVDSIDSEDKVFNRMIYGDWGLSDLMTFNIIGQPAVFMRHKTLNEAGTLDLGFHYLLDHHLWLRMALIAGIKYIPGQSWAAARIHPAAKNVINTQGFGQEAFRIADWMKSDSRFQPFAQNLKHRILAGAHRLNAFYLLDGDHPRAALKAYWKGFWQYPPAVQKDWRRILFALLSPLGLEGLKTNYLNRRKTHFEGGK